MFKLAKDLGYLLQQKNYSLATAESCTGGQIAAAITAIPGSSQWFDRGFVTYSNLAKIEMLAVPEQTIIQFGAVSEETAWAMTLGAIHHSRAQIAISVTGIAGPQGGSVLKPVGTVCFGFAITKKIILTELQFFQGNRVTIQQQATRFALEKLLILLLENLY